MSASRCSISPAARSIKKSISRAASSPPRGRRSLPIAGAKLNVASAVKPALDGMVREQISALEARLRNDPFIENAARSQWTKLCRAIPLSGGGQTGAPASASTAASGLPNLWLEIKPVRAIAAQPQVDANALTLLVGVQAQ